MARKRKTLPQATQAPPDEPGLPPEGPAELAQWAMAKGVTDLLTSIPPAFLEHTRATLPREYEAAARYRNAGSSILGMFGASTYWVRASVELRLLARRWLRDQVAARTARARELLAARPQRASDPRLERHAEALLLARKALLERGVGPRSPGERTIPRVTLVPFPTALQFTYELGTPWQRVDVTVSVRLEPNGSVAIEPFRKAVPDVLLVEMLGEALAILTSPTKAKLAQTLAEELSIAPWTRLLRDLGEGLGAGRAAAPVDFELGWRFSLHAANRSALTPVACRPKVRGGYKVAALTREQTEDLEMGALDARDAGLFRLVTVSRSAPHYSHYSDVTMALGTDALHALVGHPRFFLRGTRDAHLELRAGALKLATRDRAGGGFQLGFEVGGELVSARAVWRQVLALPLERAVLLVDEERRVATLCELSPVLRRAVAAAAQHPDTLPAEAAAPFVKLAITASAAMPIAVSEGLRGPSQPGDGTPRVRLTYDGEHVTVSAVVQPVAELGAMPPGAGEATLTVARGGALVAVARDLPAERAAAEAIWGALGLERGDDGFNATARLGDGALDLVRAASELEGVEVEWSTERRLQVAESLAASALRLEARAGKGRAWFSLGGEAVSEGGGAVPLAEILRAIRERQRYVKVDAERWAEIDGTLARKLAALAKRDGNIPAVMAPLVAELEEAGAELRGVKDLFDGLARLEAARRLEVEVPEGLLADLRPYQRDGFEWLARLAAWAPGACLADDMGLGKTVQALALLLRRAAEGPALVIAPTSLGFNWAREAARFAPGLELRGVRTGAELAEVGELGPGVVLVMSYGLAARHAERLGETLWATMVLDEAQSVKNAATQRARALHGLEARFTLALTGTPVENRAEELWSLFRLIAPGLLGSAASFREQFAAPLERGDEVARGGLAALVAPFVLRRLKRDVAKELPPRTEVQHEVVLGKRERERYEEIRRATLLLLDGVDDTTPAQQRRFKALQALTRLRQMACHPGLLDPSWDGGSRKLDALCELLERLRDEGHKALIFSQFTTFLAKARERIGALGLSACYLDGSTSPTARQAEVDRFQGGGVDVFLLSLKAGGTGLNLTAATYVIHLDPWWNPAVEDQATDRAHRIGQDQPVTVYRLIAKDTVEEGIVKLHGEKRELADALLAGAGSSEALGYDEMVALIMGAGAGPALGADDDHDDDDDAALRGPAPEAATAALSPPGPEEVAAPRAAAAGATSAHAPLEDALRELARTLEAAVAAESIGAATAKSYLRVARRAFEFGDVRGLPAGSEACVDAYAAAVEAGEHQAPKSDPMFARATRRWLSADTYDHG